MLFAGLPDSYFDTAAAFLIQKMFFCFCKLIPIEGADAAFLLMMKGFAMAECPNLFILAFRLKMIKIFSNWKCFLPQV